MQTKPPLTKVQYDEPVEASTPLSQNTHIHTHLHIFRFDVSTPSNIQIQPHPLDFVRA
jgi:hypothetical protein